MRVAKKYSIILNIEERKKLVDLTKRGRAPARMIARAHILLLADKGLPDEEIVHLLDVSVPTVGRVRKRFITEGLDSALTEKPRPGARKKIAPVEREVLSALLLTPPPCGHERWSLRLIAEKLIELKLVESISHETVRSALKASGTIGL